MNTSLFKTSYTRSIISNPSAALPQIPTLAELRERTDALPIPIQPRPQPETRSDTLFSWNSMSIPKSFLPAYAVTGGPPPEYTASPIGRESWVKLGDELSMQGGKGRMDGFDRQPEIEQIEDEKREKGWMSWSASLMSTRDLELKFEVDLSLVSH